MNPNVTLVGVGLGNNDGAKLRSTFGVELSTLRPPGGGGHISSTLLRLVLPLATALPWQPHRLLLHSPQPCHALQVPESGRPTAGEGPGHAEPGHAEPGARSACPSFAKPGRLTVSNWGAPNLSLEQYKYAAADAICSEHIYKELCLRSSQQQQQ